MVTVSLRKTFFMALCVLVFACGIAGMASAQAGMVNVNTASMEELDTLSGIGPVIAERIVAEREANGPYKSVEDLQRVKGIGPKGLEKIRKSIVVADPS